MGARDVFANWLEGAPEDVRAGAKLNHRDCYREGCVVDIELGSAAAHPAMVMSFSQSPSFHAWRGPKYCSGPITAADGRIKATCVAFRPEE